MFIFCNYYSFILFFSGQVIDSLATPLAGWAIDYTGQRKLWHFGGKFHIFLLYRDDAFKIEVMRDRLLRLL